MCVLGKRGRNSQSVGPFLKTQRRRRHIVAARRFMDEITDPRKAEAKSFTELCPASSSLQIHDLGTPGKVAAKSRQKNVRHTLAILVKEV